MCSLSLEIARVTQLLLDVVDRTVVSGMTIVRGTCRQDCQDGIPCCPDLCCLIILPFHLVQNEQMKQNIFISSSFCLKTKDDVSSLRLPSEHCLIQATVLLKLVGVAPCSKRSLKMLYRSSWHPCPCFTNPRHRGKSFHQTKQQGKENMA